MRRLAIAALAASVAALASCSLVYSFDGYSSAYGLDAAIGDAPADGDAIAIDTGSTESSVDSSSDAPIDSALDALDSTPPTDAPPDAAIDTFPGPGDYLVVIGGSSGTSSTRAAKSTVWLAHLAADGSPERWIEQAPLPEPAGLEGLVAVSMGGEVYVLGGGPTASAASSKGYVARISSGGTIDGWTALALDEPRRAHAAVIAKGLVHVTGGVGSGGATMRDVARASIGTSSLGAWSTSTSLEYTLRNHAAAYFSNSLYTFGGQHDDDSFEVETVRYLMNGDGSLGSVAYNQTTANNLGPKAFHTAAQYGLRFYAIGGYDGSVATSSVSEVHIGASDGILGAWSVSSRALPSARWAHAGAQLDDRVYVLGGVLDGGAITNEVDVGIVGLDEEITWSTRAEWRLPEGRAFGAAAVLSL